MTTIRLRFAGLLAVALAAAAHCAHAQQGGSALQRTGVHMVIGSGKLQTETRSVSGYSAVALHGSMTLVLRQSAREAVEVRADDNLLALIETRVVDRAGMQTLEIGTKSGASYTTRSEITVTVDAITLQALSVTGSGNAISVGLKTPKLALAVSGSGDVELRLLSADELSVNVSGSGDVNLAGRAAKLSVAIGGSGDVSADGLDALDVSVSITGSGDASVNARKTLTVSIAGSGDVAYVGDAAVKSSISGSGTVMKKR